MLLAHAVDAPSASVQQKAAPPLVPEKGIDFPAHRIFDANTERVIAATVDAAAAVLTSALLVFTLMRRFLPSQAALLSSTAPVQMRTCATVAEKARVDRIEESMGDEEMAEVPLHSRGRWVFVHGTRMPIATFRRQRSTA